MRKILLLLIAVILINATLVFAETVPDEKAVKDLANKIMAKISTGNIDDACSIMKPYMLLSETEINTVVLQIKLAKGQFDTRYGLVTAYEFIDSKKIGDSLLRLRYIEKTNTQALPWAFYFYKTKEGWILNSFFWREDYKELF